jgi:hypothetical protein
MYLLLLVEAEVAEELVLALEAVAAEELVV